MVGPVKNPIRLILGSQSPRAVKIIALSLLLVLVCAAPIMLYGIFGPENGNPVALGWLFAVGAVVAHIGFLIGMLLLIWDLYFAKK